MADSILAGQTETSKELDATYSQPRVNGSFVGLWQRIVLEEPPGVVVDQSSFGSVVLWLQSPSGSYIDVRNVKKEGRPRAFAGVSSCTESSDGQTIITWTRYLDTAPEHLPSGIDSALCILSADGNEIVEDGGEEYKETWHKVAEWDESKWGDGGGQIESRNSVVLECGAVAAKVERSEAGTITTVQLVDKREGASASIAFAKEMGQKVRYQ